NVIERGLSLIIVSVRCDRVRAPKGRGTLLAYDPYRDVLELGQLRGERRDGGGRLGPRFLTLAEHVWDDDLAALIRNPVDNDADLAHERRRQVVAQRHRERMRGISGCVVPLVEGDLDRLLELGDDNTHSLHHGADVAELPDDALVFSPRLVAVRSA